MQLSLHTDYALRTLMALAASGSQLSVDTIARRYGISRNHLAKVAQRLQAEGLVTTARGRTGGMRLARAVDDINVGDVVRRFETLDSFVACFGSAPTGCALQGVCGLNGALAGALDAFLTHLDGYRLSDLVLDRATILRRLGLEPLPAVASSPDGDSHHAQ